MFIKIEQVKDKSFDNMVKLYISTGLVRDKRLFKFNNKIYIVSITNRTKYT